MVPAWKGALRVTCPDTEVISIMTLPVSIQQEGRRWRLLPETIRSGSSRDWSAKGPRLLGVRVVIAIF
ncbi:hypothetical protein ACNKHO_08180 [Shigella flexneri]